MFFEFWFSETLSYKSCKMSGPPRTSAKQTPQLAMRTSVEPPGCQAGSAGNTLWDGVCPRGQLPSEKMEGFCVYRTEENHSNNFTSSNHLLLAHRGSERRKKSWSNQRRQGSSPTHPSLWQMDQPVSRLWEVVRGTRMALGHGQQCLWGSVRQRVNRDVTCP